MKKALAVVVLLAVVGTSAWYYKRGTTSTEAAPATPTPAAGRGGGRGGGSTIMTVDTATVARGEIIDYITVVGNLVGETTVDVTPRVGGRIESVFVKLGDRVTKSQPIAKMEDRDIREQVNQAEANLEVNKATAVQRESDLKVAQATFDRFKASYDHGLVSKQNLEDAEGRYNSAVGAVAVVKAQLISTQARIDELKVTFSNTSILSPVDGFVGRRNLDPGSFAGTNTVIVSVVDIGTVRLIANLVEKDFKRVQPGVQAQVEVDAFQGEQFSGKVSRVAPMFDPATRTASMEIEVPNPGYRLKPGMYARVKLTAERRPDILVVPRNALVDLESRRGVYVIDQQDKQTTARFVPVQTGLGDADHMEIVEGLEEGQKIVTVGALALRDGDRVNVVSGRGRGRGKQ